ncbi:MAG: amidohydrolase family protein, partial [Oligosphaeraceae bacterium]|nr:amidohydrolase family protein [Oligosphaeraceae bacterium]
GEDQRWQNRLQELLSFTAAAPGFRPVMWIDPLEHDIYQQLDACIQAGVKAFKVICTNFHPHEAEKVFRAIAERGYPIIFHSGVLYDKNVSSGYNHPMAFEFLMKIPNLVFALAHIGWPWCDEAIALFGKFAYLHRVAPDQHTEMYLDFTPGTPGYYRLDAFRKLFLTGYAVDDRIVWGTDHLGHLYDPVRIRQSCQRDRRFLDMVLSEAPEFISPAAVQRLAGVWEKLTDTNIRRFYREI